MDTRGQHRIALQHRMELIILYGECNRNAEATARRFNEIYSGMQPIGGRYVRRLINKFMRCGFVADMKIPGRPPSVSDVSGYFVIREAEENPRSSTRRIAQACDVSHTTAWRILKKAKMRRYVEHQTQRLYNGDLDVRFNFCKHFLEKIDINSVVFTDEAVFSLYGRVSKVYFWARSNPRRYRASKTQQNPKLMVWVGIIGRRLIGPYFFSSSVTGERSSAKNIKL